MLARKGHRNMRGQYRDLIREKILQVQGGFFQLASQGASPLSIRSLIIASPDESLSSCLSPYFSMQQETTSAAFPTVIVVYDACAINPIRWKIILVRRCSC